MRTETALVMEQTADPPCSSPEQKSWQQAGGDSVPTILTVSRQRGCNSSETARRLASQLGYDLFDGEVVEKISRHAHVWKSQVEAVDEKGLSAPVDLMGGVSDPRQPWASEYLRHLTEVLAGIVKRGRAVIVGRGAHYILLRRDTFKVRLIAPFETRVQNVAEGRKISLERASEIVRRTDSERRDFVHKFFLADWDDPGLYDLVLNVESKSPEAAAEVIRAAYEALRESKRARAA